LITDQRNNYEYQQHDWLLDYKVFQRGSAMAGVRSAIGDFSRYNRTIFSGSMFPTESSGLKHNKAGLLSMRRSDQGVQFRVTYTPTPWLDESRISWFAQPDPKVVHVVIGEVVAGLTNLHRLMPATAKDIHIANCGGVARKKNSDLYALED